MYLTQGLPATAQGIADRLGIESIQIDDLDREAVAVRFGAFFLGNQLRQFDQRLYLALAAYNGGPGNAQRWLDSYGDQDADQFVERIDYNETRTYVKRVIGQYAFYQRLYAP